MSTTSSPRPGIARWPWLVELGIVLWVSLGASAVRALLNLVNRLTLEVPLSEQTATIVASVTPDRPALDVAYQVAGIFLALGPVALVWYLMRRSGEGVAAIGLDRAQPRHDLGRGLGLAALVGSVGLAFYLLSYQLGINVAITAVDAAQFWWTTPLLLLEAAQNAVVEEVIILGYFLHRTRQAGVAVPVSIAGAALIRGTYHLYQGFGGFLGNLVMGLFFGWLYTRWRRTGPFIVAHFLIDAVAFAGYFWLRDSLPWLP